MRKHRISVIVKVQKGKWWVEGNRMTWDWSSPIAMGLFVVMAGVGVLLLAIALAIVSGNAKVSDLRRH